MEDNQEIKALENFLMDIEILDTLETKLVNFNLFETLGIVNTEIRHSNVLAWLLSPRENHGLGDIILKVFVQRLFQQYNSELKNVNTTLLQVALMDFYDFQVRREWKNIDIAVFSEINKFVIIIENKIWSGEASHQLDKYYRTVNEEFEGFEKIFLFLTPDGLPPSDTTTWLSIGYTFFIDIIVNALTKKSEAIPQSVKLFIEHYIEILRRHIVGHDELVRICRQIYNKHQKALDLIYKHIPDTYSEISSYIEECIKQYSNISFDSSTKSLVRFLTNQLDNLLGYKGKGWTSSNRILLYEFQNRGEKLALKLIIGPGEQVIREKLFAIAKNNPTLFKGMLGGLTPQYTQIYAKEILHKNFIEKYEYETIQEKINKEISNLMNGDIKEIEETIIRNF